MPNKKIDDLKDPIDRDAGQQWQRAIGISDLTTRELQYICDNLQGKTDGEIREIILKRRAEKK